MFIECVETVWKDLFNLKDSDRKNILFQFVSSKEAVQAFHDLMFNQKVEWLENTKGLKEPAQIDLALKTKYK